MNACRIIRDQNQQIVEIQTITGESSYLYEQMYSHTKNPQTALSAYEYVRSPSFKQMYGDWELQALIDKIDSTTLLQQELVEDEYELGPPATRWDLSRLVISRNAHTNDIEFAQSLAKHRGRMIS